MTLREAIALFDIDGTNLNQVKEVILKAKVK